MIRRVLETVFNISLTECPRAGYAWILRFLLKMGFVVGWTTLIAISVTRFSIEMLPLVFMINALFTVVGMLLFSFLVDKVSVRRLVPVLLLLCAISLLGAVFFYDHGVMFFVFALMATGLFFPQIALLLSSFIEDLFTPNEALRAQPVVESAETIGGIIGGIFLVSMGVSSGSGRFLLLWVCCLVLFFLAFSLFRPKLPVYLEKISKESETKTAGNFNLNALGKSLHEIKIFPFLQILSVVVFFQWMIFYFIEFQYTKAAAGFIDGGETLSSKEQALTHGLGSLQILFYSSALLVELVLTGKILKKFGAFGGFLLHAIMTFLGAFSLLFGFGFFTAVLARNNFEMSTIVYRNSYENVYYSFRNGTHRALREFYEGLIYPVATVVATAVILFIEFFFLEEHFVYVAQLSLIFLVVAKLYFSFHLQKKYTEVALDGLSSDVPLIRYRAIEILSQKGHHNSYELLWRAYGSSVNDPVMRKKVLEGLGYLGDLKAVQCMLDVLCDPLQKELHSSALSALKELSFSLKRNEISRRLRKKVEGALLSFIPVCEGNKLKTVALSTLDAYSPAATEQFLHEKDTALRGEALRLLWHRKAERHKVKTLLLDMAKDLTKENLRFLCFLSGNAQDSFFRNFSRQGVFGIFGKLTDSRDDEMRLIAYTALFKAHYYRYADDLIHLLFHGNDVLFAQAMELFESFHPTAKRVLVKSLRHGFFEDIVSSESGQSSRALTRVKTLLEVCDAYDEHSFFQNFFQNPGLNPGVSLVAPVPVS